MCLFQVFIMRLCHNDTQHLNLVMHIFDHVFTFAFSLLTIYSQILNIFDISVFGRNETSKSYVTLRNHFNQLNSIIIKISV